MQILMAGSSGFMGQALTTRLRSAGHDVVRLVRRVPEASDERQWDPAAGELDAGLVADADVVVNLCGSPLLGIPYLPSHHRRLYESRIGPTRLLADAIAAAGSPPALVNAGGCSHYGDHGSEVVIESSELRGGDAPLERVARDWETATKPAGEAGARVCILRTAPVMSRGSQAMKLLTPMFRFGLGARLSSGDQFFPVLSQQDWLGAAMLLVTSDTASGPFNVCTPVTPTNAEFTEALADAVNRKAFLAVPSPVLRLGAGPMAVELLRSLNLHPAALLAEGYEFSDPDVDAVLAGQV
ncbi:TIGR01777 family oxidoreductase [Nocardioides coralli]|uniref:TIGR01777 family oxidoreductase n=1 Tax=Nocardioides coralli TaxID=2872154 RepID=UPI001CA414A6|nr:TIGR01777 family oxidoreductase [Nocardioides coralli]QZY30382.1 TIGR01777 family oxidoreductase [Nocardioides coralli]